MRILVNPGRLGSISRELNAISRRVQYLNGDVAQVKEKLKTLSGMEECLLSLSGQEYAMEELSGRTAELASALLSAGAQYERIEEQNAQILGL